MKSLYFFSFIFLLNIFLNISCTTIAYKSSNEIPVSIYKKSWCRDEFVINGETDFYLWGMVPSSRTIWLDQEIGRSAMTAGANIVIEEFQSFKNLFLTIISFGMYVPMNYTIVGYGEKISIR